MIIDSHAYCFEALDSPRGYSSGEEHLRWAQAANASHHQPAMRIPDGEIGPSEVLDPAGTHDIDNLPDLRAILERCRPWVMEVHHVGSTSVPGLAAKPILDIMPVVANPGHGENAVEPMTTQGYKYRGENGLRGRFYFDKIVDGRTVVHCHMYPQDHSDVRKLVAFRNQLRTDSVMARDYERLKRKLALKYRDDRPAYTDAKGTFIREITELALAELQDGQEEEQ